MSISQPILTPLNYAKGSMVYKYPHSTRWVKNIVVIPYYNGVRAISLLFCDRQDTESGLFEIELSISQPILTHRKILESL